MPMFRKLPVVIEAIQYTHSSGSAIRAWSGNAFIESPVLEDGTAYGQVTTMEGPMTASIGDWIIKGVRGEFYPCRADIFALTYEEVPDAM